MVITIWSRHPRQTLEPHTWRHEQGVKRVFVWPLAESKVKVNQLLGDVMARVQIRKTDSSVDCDPCLCLEVSGS